MTSTNGHVEDCVENLANIHLAPTAAALGWRDHRLNAEPDSTMGRSPTDRALPKDLPPKSTAHSYFMLWDWDGTLERVHHARAKGG